MRTTSNALASSTGTPLRWNWVLALLFFCTVVLFLTARGGNDPKLGLAGWFCFATVGFVLVLVFPAAIVQTRVIRPIEIRTHDITLTNVAKDFVRAMKEARLTSKHVLPVEEV